MLPLETGTAPVTEEAMALVEELTEDLIAPYSWTRSICAFEVLGIERLSWRPKGIVLGEVDAPEPIPMLRCRVRHGLLGELGPGDEFLVRQSSGRGWDVNDKRPGSSPLHLAALSWHHGIDGVSDRSLERLERLADGLPVFGLQGQAFPLEPGSDGGRGSTRDTEVRGRTVSWAELRQAMQAWSAVNLPQLRLALHTSAPRRWSLHVSADGRVFVQSGHPVGPTEVEREELPVVDPVELREALGGLTGGFLRLDTGARFPDSSWLAVWVLRPDGIQEYRIHTGPFDPSDEVHLRRLALFLARLGLLEQLPYKRTLLEELLVDEPGTTGSR